jgi:Large polyvalent protein associated domain 38
VPEGEAARPPEEQYGPETSDSMVALGRRLGVSPRLLEYALNNYTGGAAGQGMWALDLGLNALGYHPEIPGAARRPERSLAQELARVPGIEGVFRATPTGVQQRGRARFDEAINETQRAFYALPDTRRLGLSFGPVADAVENVVLEPAERADYQRRALEYATDNLDRVQSRARYENADDATKRALAADAIAAGRAKAAAEILKEIPRDERRERTRLP